MDLRYQTTLISMLMHFSIKTGFAIRTTLRRSRDWCF